MRRTIHTVWRSVRAGLLAGLFLAAMNAARGQPVPERTPAAAAVTPATPAPAPLQKESIKAPQEKAVKFWARVPPLRPMDRIGYFLVLPTGPGYYSLLFLLLDEPLAKPLKTPYPPVSGDGYSFYDADYRYLESPAFGQVDFFSPLKRIHAGEDWLLSLGGEERVRYMDENGGYARFTGQVNTYELIRSRVYTDVWYLDRFRVYAEMQDSRIANNDLPPLPNDVNHADIQNLFADAKLFAVNQQPAYVRVGRQEMYFGSQRLISPSDFPNVRRTFQGAAPSGWARTGTWTPSGCSQCSCVQPVSTLPTTIRTSPDCG